jgi:hypothetical protein
LEAVLPSVGDGEPAANGRRNADQQRPYTRRNDAGFSSTAPLSRHGRMSQPPAPFRGLDLCRTYDARRSAHHQALDVVLLCDRWELIKDGAGQMVTNPLREPFPVALGHG